VFLSTADKGLVACRELLGKVCGGVPSDIEFGAILNLE